MRKNPESLKEDIAASFQLSVVEVLTKKSIEAAKTTGIHKLVLSGGVSANSALRESIMHHASKEGIDVFLPSLHLCTDNAAMIASAGYYRFQKGDIANYTLNPKSYLPLGSADG